MIRLIGVELTRMSKRRAVVALVVTSLVLPLLFLAIALWNTRPAPESEIEWAKEQVAQDRKAMAGEVRRCVRQREEYGVSKDATAQQARRQCREMMGEPELRNYLGRTQLGLKSQLHGEAIALITVVTVLLMLAAATFIGHDWASGSMSNQLLFEPRRHLVWSAKALAVLLGSFVVAALAYAVYWLGLVIAMHVRDLPIGDGRVMDGVQALAMAAVFTAAASLGAYAITMLFRSTVVTLGILFAVMVAGAIVVSLIPTVDREQWQMPTNVAAWIFGEGRYYRHLPQSCWDSQTGMEAPGAECRQQGVVSRLAATAYLGLQLLVACGLSLWSFGRRDVP